MENNTKRWVGWALVFGLVVSSVSLAAYVHSYGENTATSNRTFSVSASGKAIAVPDVAEFTFSVTSEGGKDLVALQKDNADRVNKVSAFLKDKNIDAKDITTTDYQLQPRYDYFPCGGIAPCRAPQISGYTLSQTTRVKVRDFNVIGDLLSGVVAQGANTVSSLTFTRDNPESALNDARADAMQKARTQAEALAHAGGFRLGRLVSLQENGSNQPVPYYAADSAVKSMGGIAPPIAAPAPDVQPGSQEVTANLVLTYEIR